MILSAAAVATVVVLVVQEVRAPRATQADGGGVELETRLAQLERAQADTRAAIEKLGTDLAARAQMAPRTPTEKVSQADIEAAVARYLKDNGAAMASPAAAQPAGAKLEMEEAMKLAAATTQEAGLSPNWQRIRDAGLEQEVLDRMEQIAKSRPDDAGAQYQYGVCLINALQDKGMPEVGLLATKADGAFDAALKADPNHWESRFSKATSLSFWPKITGKHLEAIKHFEILAEQQERGPSQPHYAETYLFLGNMQLDNGNKEKAKAAFERGLRYFPGHTGLKAQLDTLGN
jgi:tetratricopeptide (TPR) repeat protein